MHEGDGVDAGAGHVGVVLRLVEVRPSVVVAVGGPSGIDALLGARLDW
jgi:hypothetical protein